MSEFNLEELKEALAIYKKKKQWWTDMRASIPVRTFVECADGQILYYQLLIDKCEEMIRKHE